MGSFVCPQACHHVSVTTCLSPWAACALRATPCDPGRAPPHTPHTHCCLHRGAGIWGLFLCEAAKGLLCRALPAPPVPHTGLILFLSARQQQRWPLRTFEKGQGVCSVLALEQPVAKDLPSGLQLSADIQPTPGTGLRVAAVTESFVQLGQRQEGGARAPPWAGITGRPHCCPGRAGTSRACLQDSCLGRGD